MKKYYDLLGVPQTATKEEIKKAYRTLSKRCHPDMPNGNTVLFLKVKEAYEALIDGEPVEVKYARHDLTPFVSVVHSNINSKGDCDIYMSMRNIKYVFIDKLPLEDYKWSILGSRDGRIEIFKQDLVKCGYSFILVFVPYEGNIILSPVNLKDPRSWRKKLVDNVKKFLSI
jgi:curved DNA-binding protein CbpA